MVSKISIAANGCAVICIVKGSYGGYLKLSSNLELFKYSPHGPHILAAGWITPSPGPEAGTSSALASAQKRGKCAGKSGQGIWGVKALLLKLEEQRASERKQTVPQPRYIMARPYRLDGLLGSGGMASVYYSFSFQGRTRCAIKVLASPRGAREPLLERNRLKQEEGILRQFVHGIAEPLMQAPPTDACSDGFALAAVL